MSSLLKLLGSTSFAQILLIAISPILTRLYSPNIFGEFLIITSWAYIINSVSLGRMDVAILTSKSNREMKFPFSLGLLFIFITVTISTIVITIIYNFYDIGMYYFIIPITVFSLASYQLLISLLLARQNLNIVARNKITQSLSLGFNQIIGGAIYPSSYTLGIAQSISLLFTSFFTRSIWASYITRIKSKRLLRKYTNYIVYDNISNLFQVISNNLPPILITYILGGYIGGLYYLAYRILIIPVSIFSVSISQFISSTFRSEQTNLSRWQSKNNSLLQIMLLIFCVPFILISTYTSSIFPQIFGSNWIETGKLVQSFAAWIFLKLIYDSFIIILSLQEKSKIKMCIDIFLFSSTLMSILTLWKLQLTGIDFLIYYSSINTILIFIIFCILNYFASFQFIKNSFFALLCILSITYYTFIESISITVILIIGLLVSSMFIYKMKKKIISK